MSVSEHIAVCNELTELYSRKNADYGDSYHETYRDEGWAAFRIRLTDKLNRFKALTREPAAVKDESIRDTLLDLANYAILAVMELDAAGKSAEKPAGKPAPFSKLNPQECILAGMLGAKYVSRDFDDDAEVDFWDDEPVLDDMIYFTADEHTRGLASVNAETIHTGLRPGDIVHVE